MRHLRRATQEASPLLCTRAHAHASKHQLVACYPEPRNLEEGKSFSISHTHKKSRLGNCPGHCKAHTMSCTNYVKAHTMSCTNYVKAHTMSCTNYVKAHTMSCTN